MQVAVFAILGLLTIGLLIMAIFALFRNTEFTFALFRYLLQASMVFAIITLVNYLVQVGSGHLGSPFEWMVASASGALALGCLLFILFRIKQ